MGSLRYFANTQVVLFDPGVYISSFLQHTNLNGKRFHEPVEIS